MASRTAAAAADGKNGNGGQRERYNGYDESTGLPGFLTRPQRRQDGSHTA